MHVAFLRSINLGGRRAPGQELVAAFEAAGARSAWTFLASGNVAFDMGQDAPDAASLEASLRAHLGFDVPVFLRSADALARAVDLDPFPGRPGDVHVAFARAPLPSDVVARLDTAGSPHDHFHVDGQDLHWLCQTRFSDSPFAGPKLERLVGTELTVRKRTTLARLVDRLRTSG